MHFSITDPHTLKLLKEEKYVILLIKLLAHLVLTFLKKIIKIYSSTNSPQKPLNEVILYHE